MNREPRTIYLIRHGKIQLPDDQLRYIGRQDVPLDETGIQQACRLQQRLDGIPITAAYCSDLSRSRRTAEIIINDTDIRLFVRQDLREIHLGEWEGCTFAEIEKRYPDEFRNRGADIIHYRVPGGESFSDCNDRVIAAFRDIVDTSSGNILIVGHAGVNRLILCYCMGEPLTNMFRIRQGYGCMNVIQQGTDGFQVVVMDDSCCLQKQRVVKPIS